MLVYLIFMSVVVIMLIVIAVHCFVSEHNSHRGLQMYFSTESALCCENDERNMDVSCHDSVDAFPDGDDEIPCELADDPCFSDAENSHLPWND